jgi:hypothetical protein
MIFFDLPDNPPADSDALLDSILNATVENPWTSPTGGLFHSHRFRAGSTQEASDTCGSKVGCFSSDGGFTNCEP